MNQSDQRVLSSLCKLLREESDIGGLLTLSQCALIQDLVLASAMDLASELGKKELATEIGMTAWKEGHAGERVLLRLLSLSKSIERQFVSILYALTTHIPIDYAGRVYVAKYFLQSGKYAESVERHIALLSNGLYMLPAVLGLGLSVLLMHRSQQSAHNREVNENN